MQNHASRHTVSEHLKDRYPCYTRSCDDKLEHSSTCVHGARVAYARQGILQILAELRNHENSAIEGMAALSLVLATQEMKAEAIRYEAPRVLISYIQPCMDATVVKAACCNLTQLIRLFDGCHATVVNGGIEALVSVLGMAPKEVACCIMELSRTPEGSQAILESGDVAPKQLADFCKVAPLTQAWETSMWSQ